MSNCITEPPDPRDTGDFYEHELEERDERSRECKEREARFDEGSTERF